MILSSASGASEKSKRQIPGIADLWPPRGRRCSHLCRSSSYRLGDRHCSRQEEMCGKPVETHLERQTKGQESQPSVQDELGGAKTPDEGHPPSSSLWTHRKGASTAQVNAMCRNLKMGTVVGTIPACAFSTVAWFFGERRVSQTAARVEQVSEWIIMWRGFNVDTRRRIRRVWRTKKGSHFGN